MRKCLLLVPFLLLAGCTSSGVVFYSPYDLDRDGVMDARCPGLEYDTSKHSWYGWRSSGSKECEKQAPGGSAS